MSNRKLLICPGATKAGTSWLYRWLSSHPSCDLRAVKELHYFSTSDPVEAAKKVSVLTTQLGRYFDERQQADADGQGWKVLNMDRRIADTSALIDVLSSDRADTKAYVDFVGGETDERQVVADITPSYATLDPENLKQMAALPFDVRVLYLVRDPLERLWSHVRMHAKRFLREGQDVVTKSGFVLGRILNKGHESHITDRGDYAGTIAKYRDVFGDRLQVAYAENLSTAAGQQEICAFMGIDHVAPKEDTRNHVGLSIPFPDQKRRATVKFLRDQYDFVADQFGPLPENWVANRQVLA